MISERIGICGQIRKKGKGWPFVPETLISLYIYILDYSTLCLIWFY